MASTNPAQVVGLPLSITIIYPLTDLILQFGLNTQHLVSGSTYIAEIRKRDQNCRITGPDTVQVAHLIPQ